MSFFSIIPFNKPQQPSLLDLIVINYFSNTKTQLYTCKPCNQDYATQGHVKGGAYLCEDCNNILTHITFSFQTSPEFPKNKLFKI